MRTDLSRRPRPSRCLLGALCLGAACAGDPSAAPDGGSSVPAAPQPGTWRRGTPMPAARSEVVAVSARGRIYLIGGLGDGGGSTRVDVYDPQAGTWSAGPDLPLLAPRHHLAAAAFADRIYLLGGYTEATFTPTARTWVLDGTWSERAAQPIARGAATAQTLGDRIHVVGGADERGIYADHYAYDPVADRWEPRRAMPTPREHLASCAVQGQLVVAGGRNAQQNLDAAERYDPAADAWTTLPPLPTARGGLAAAAVGPICYVVGGEALDRAPPNTFPDNEGFDSRTGTFQRYAPLPTARHGLGAAGLGGVLYVLAGGETAGFSYSDRLEIFTP